MKRDADAEVNESRTIGIQKAVAILPENAQQEGVVTSPQKNASVYQCAGERTRPLMAWLHRVLPSIPVKPATTEELWISGLDTPGMYEIGCVAGGKEQQIENLEFLPDGKQISFVYHGTPYVMPIQKPK
jgi:hypothetical protein